MAVVAKRSVMTLYSNPTDMTSHQIRIVLAEKGVVYEVINVVGENKPAELIDLNPYNSVPTLVDRELVLFEAGIIMEYLDERFPHPPLMPVYPVARARSRLMMHRFERDWFCLVAQIQQGKSEKEKDKARSELTESLLTVAPVFGDNPYFLSEEFTLVDCYLAPLLWRLDVLGIKLKGRGAKEIQQYMDRLFERESFQASLTELEQEMR
jgi:RNA polymerase-associated protein